MSIVSCVLFLIEQKKTKIFNKTLLSFVLKFFDCVYVWNLCTYMKADRTIIIIIIIFFTLTDVFLSSIHT